MMGIPSESICCYRRVQGTNETDARLDEKSNPHRRRRTRYTAEWPKSLANLPSSLEMI